ncbi:MAG TPA: GNAT family N-acetyltransferase [Actinotalea sp.]|nr:GNAT family N-acetyltransferase [Actinotalea sp.]
MPDDVPAVPGTTPAGGGVRLADVGWDDAEAAALRDEQQAELAARYDGVEDLEPVLPAEQMIATVLVRVDGCAVACGSLRVVPELGAGVGELKRMYVRPGYRGRGLSRLVLRALESRALDAGLDRLVLETGVRQPEALGLYRSAGYRQVARYGAYLDEPGSVCLARTIRDNLTGP